MMPSKEPVVCPDCGGLEFEVCGYVFYRQPYIGHTREYGYSDVHWDCDYPEYVECRTCQHNVTAYFIERGILGTFFTVQEKHE